MCEWGAGDKGGQHKAELCPYASKSVWQLTGNKAKLLLSGEGKKPHSQKAKERVPQGHLHLLSQCPACSPCSGLNHDGGCSPSQASSWLSPFCFKAAGKTFPLGPSRPTAAGGWRSTSHGLPRVKENKNEPQIQEGKKGWYAKY